jgi:hypothetical protein
MDTDGYKQKQTSDSKPNVMHVLQPIRVRHTFQSYNGIDRFLLDYGYNFLPYITVISWIIFLLVKY